MSALFDSKTKSMDDRGIRALLSDDHKYQSWLDVEAALATAQGELGVIPREAAAQIASACQLKNIDLEEVQKLQEKIGHGFVPFLKALVRACPGDSGKYVHLGVTTQNIQQSAQLLVTRKVHNKFLVVTHDILHNLAALAEQHAQTVMPGRTHGRHAIPITYGFKVAVWIDEILSAAARLEESEKRVFRVMMGGAVGAFNASGNTGRKVQTRVAGLLNMQEMSVPSRNIGTHKVEYVMALSLLASVCHKMAEEVYATTLEEIGEVIEGFRAGTVGSSTMPHKINPKLAKGIIANAQKLYSLPAVMMSACCRPYEADSSAYMLLESSLHEALQLMTEIVLRAEELTRCLHVNPQKMSANAEINHGLDNSEFVMMQLASTLGKDQAHAKVYEMAIDANLNGKEFMQCLQKDKQVSALFTTDELKQMLIPHNYTGEAANIALEQAQRARGVAQAQE
ncbi:class-II fumarase/aspartase family protein [Dryocola sp. BD613]|uniref:class-II fumarase/aspartase family protein n=1 Tax=Dryocola sp. BD613 TaxID=3133272 RepID=UPI003F4FF8AD